MKYPEQVSIFEVCPRDGLQNEPEYITADRKIDLAFLARLPWSSVTILLHRTELPTGPKTQCAVSGRRVSRNRRISRSIRLFETRLVYLAEQSAQPRAGISPLPISGRT